MNLIKKIFFIFVIIIVVFALTKNIIVKAAVENGVGLATGLKLNMKSLKVGILNTNLVIKELKIYNPKGFEEPVMLDMPEITVDYNLGDIIGGNIHLENVVVNLQEFNVVKNREGALNLDSLKIAKEGKEKEKKPAEPAEPKEKKKTKLQIDNLELVVGKVSFKDYTGETPSVNDFEFNLNESHQNITRPEVLIAIIVQKALLKASIAKISGFDLGGIQGSLTNAVGDLSNIAGQASELASGALDSAKDLADSVDMDKMKAMSDESLNKMKAAGSESVDKVKDLGDESLNKLKGLGSSLKSLGGDTADSAGSTLKGLGDKLKLPGGDK